MFALPLIAKGTNRWVDNALDATLLSIIVGPIILWRIHASNLRAAASRAAESARRALIASKRRLVAVTAGVVVLGVAASVGSMMALHRSVMSEARERFARLADSATASIENVAKLPFAGLKGARGVYASSKSVERDEFAACVASRDLTHEFPGVIGMGVIKRTMRENLDRFLTAERADNAPNLTVQSLAASGSLLAEAPDLYVVTACFPKERNSAAWGLDVGSEAVRREAITRAVATGEPAVSGRITLAQDESKRTGFLYLLPVYRNGTHPTTPEERCRDLDVLVYAAVVLEHVLEDIGALEYTGIDVELYDGVEPEASQLLYNGDGRAGIEHEGKPLFTTHTALTIGGQTWTAVLRTQPYFQSSVALWSAPCLGIGGVLLALLAGASLWTVGLSGARAEQLVVERTTERGAFAPPSRPARSSPKPTPRDESWPSTTISAPSAAIRGRN
ncbi:MAG: CHASE domain-containing protein [Planctomycetes bacterium]|nr:CHASE domain-containing protein [Planctomycetota bacterium]